MIFENDKWSQIKSAAGKLPAHFPRANKSEASCASFTYRITNSTYTAKADSGKTRHVSEKNRSPSAHSYTKQQYKLVNAFPADHFPFSQRRSCIHSNPAIKSIKTSFLPLITRRYVTYMHRIPTGFDHGQEKVHLNIKFAR